jgi:ferredoxin
MLTMSTLPIPKSNQENLAMRTEIYYFSGTGNSLAVAQSVARELGETDLIPIPKAMRNNLDTTAPRLGLVFPVYVWGLPRIVVDFARELKPHNVQYVFAVTTCGGTPGATLLQLQRLLRKNGTSLDAGFVVREVNNTPFTSDDPLIRFVRDLNRKPLPPFAAERLPAIVSTIRDRQKHAPETSSTVTNLIGGLLWTAAIQTLKQSSRDYWVDEKCNLCGLCERICPRENIKIAGGKVSWQRDCEQCLACLQWCPQEAIQYKDQTQARARGHHPDVKIRDMILR